jgi:hypothetical protein
MKKDVSLTIPLALSATAAALVAVCAVIPTMVPGVYRAVPASLLAGTYGQDWTSLLLVALLAWAVRSTVRGSLAGPIVWLAVLGFWAYGYALFAFGGTATWLYPAYIAILGLTAWALLLLATRLDASAYAERLNAATRRWPMVTMLGVTVGLLGPVWIALMGAALAAGKLPPTANVFVLDLAFVFPAMILAIVGLVRRRDWGWPLGGSLVVLAAVMLASLVVSDAAAPLLRVPGDPLPLTLTFAALALASAAASAPMLRALGGPSGPDPDHAHVDRRWRARRSRASAMRSTISSRIL